jgi:probable rRNA maturation factor
MQKNKPLIHFFYQAPYQIRNATRLKKDILGIFKKEKKTLRSLNYIFCTDNYLLQINKHHLKHNNLTDIITFDLSENEETEGEIYISLDRVFENAKEFNSSKLNELKRVIFHGALHLCGYKDKKPGDIRVMRAKEDFYLNLSK